MRMLWPFPPPEPGRLSLLLCPTLLHPPITRQRLLIAPHQQLDRIGNVFVHDVGRARVHALPMGLKQHLGMGAANRRVKFVTRALQQLAKRIAKVDRIHKAAINLTAVRNAARSQALADLRVGCARDDKGDVMQVADALRVGRRINLACIVGEDRDQAAIPRVKIQMVLRWHIKIGLLKDKRHAHHALPKINAGLAVRTDQRDVVHALRLDFLHARIMNRGKCGTLAVAQRPTFPRIQ